MAPRRACAPARAGGRRAALAFVLLPAIFTALGGHRQSLLVPPPNGTSGPAVRWLPVGAGTGRLHQAHNQRRVGCRSLDASTALDGSKPSFAAEEGNETAIDPPPDQWNAGLWALRGIAGAGALDTAYLTSVKLGQVPLMCPSDPSAGCNQVLNSPWASVGPVPLATIGLVAYLAVAVMSWTVDWTRERFLWWLCLLMTAVSLGLEAIILLVIGAPCVFCAISACCSAFLFVIVDAAQRRREGLSPRRTVLSLASLVALGALRVGTLPGSRVNFSFYDLAQQYKPEHPPLRSVSSEAEKALARHLTSVGAACYTAWWCPHCQEQREQFGSEAASLAPFVQCSTENRRQKPECKDKNIDGYPTWIIDGKKYSGGQDLAKLARLTGFTAFPESAFQPRSDEVTEYIWGKRPEPETDS